MAKPTLSSRLQKIQQNKGVLQDGAPSATAKATATDLTTVPTPVTPEAAEKGERGREAGFEVPMEDVEEITVDEDFVDEDDEDYVDQEGDGDEHDDDEYEEQTVLEDDDDDEEDDQLPKVVLYHQGATELFLRVEESNWHAALSQLTMADGERQVRTWIQSTGSSNNNSNMISNNNNKSSSKRNTPSPWSNSSTITSADGTSATANTTTAATSTGLWRRLPIHEACRRQAPAWLISRLLSLYPESAFQKTQFGELPLHLAVECGAAPEVVNLLVVAYWNGIVETDQSGRTPLEMLQEESCDGTQELLNVEDYKVVCESLQRSQSTWDEIQTRHASQIQALQLEHKQGLQAVCAQHQLELAEEFQQHQMLLEKIQNLTLLIERLQVKCASQQERIDSFEKVECVWRERVDKLQHGLETSQQEVAVKKDEVANLARILVQKNRRIQMLDDENAILKSDLAASFARQSQLAQSVSTAVEHDLHQLVSSFCKVQDLLSCQHKDLRQVLHQRVGGAHHVANVPRISPLWMQPQPQSQPQPQPQPQQGAHAQTSQQPPLSPSQRHPTGGGVGGGGSSTSMTTKTTKELGSTTSSSSRMVAGAARAQNHDVDDYDNDGAEKKTDHDHNVSLETQDTDAAFQSIGAAASTALLQQHHQQTETTTAMM